MDLEAYKAMLGISSEQTTEVASDKPRYYYDEKSKHWIQFGTFRIVDAEYCAWAGAEQRCQNSNSTGYANYGGRGIQMKFTTFQRFYGGVRAET